MNTQLPVGGKPVLVAAIFCTVCIAFMRLSFHYHIDIGIVGGAIWEMTAIPAILTSFLILLYTLYAILFKKSKDAKIIIACILAGAVIVSLFI